MTFRKARKIESDDDEDQVLDERENNYSMSDSSDDEIENEEELLKQEGAEFINDDIDESEDEGVHYNYNRNKINNSDSDNDSDGDLSMDENSLQEEIDDLKGVTAKKGRLQRAISDDEEEEEEYMEKRIDSPERIPSPDLGSEEENEDENEIDDNLDDFIVDDRKRKNKERNEEDFPVFKSNRERDAMELFGCDTADLENLCEIDDYDMDAEAHIDKAKLFDPEDLERGFHTEKDEIIRQTDLPERFQIKSLQCEEITLNDKSLKFEASMIYEELFKNREGNKAAYGKVLVKFLHLIRRGCFEVPYIIIHEKDNIVEEGINLEIADLWKVFDFHCKWNQIINRISRMLAIVDRLPEDQNFSHRAHFREVIKSVRNLDESSIVNDLINFHLELENKSSKAIKNFRLEKNAKLDELASMFGLEAEKFSINLNERYMKYPIQNPDLLPNDLANKFISGPFSTTEKVLRGSRAILGHLISKQLFVIRFVDEFFLRHGKIKIRPTTVGLSTIDSKHDMYNYEYITDKPISDFYNNYDFLIINQAEKDKLITLEIYLLADDKEKLIGNLFEYFSNDECNAIAKAWNFQRRLVMSEILDRSLIQNTVKKFRKNLLELSQEKLAQEVANKLYEKINVCTFGKEMEVFNPKMMGLSYNSGTNEKHIGLTIIDEYGSVLENVLLTKYVPYPHSERERESKKVELAKIIELIHSHQVSGIAITGHCKMAQKIQSDIEEEIDNADRVNEIGNVKTIIVDPTFAVVFENSIIANKLYPHLTPLMKKSVGVALNRTDPLLAYSQLMNFDGEIKKLSLHLHSSLVNENVLMTAYERKFVEVVSHVGVDINDCLRHPQLLNQLQFVPGLGMRKAKHLVEQIIERSRNTDHVYDDDYYTENLSAFISNRTDLLSQGYLGFKVAANCASFLRIVGYSQDEHGHILDETRINPMNYECAHKIANDALELDYPVSNQEALRSLIQNPTELDRLDLDEFVKTIYEAEKVKTKYLIDQIKRELQNPFHDYRPKFPNLSTTDLFWLFINETPDSFNVKMVAEFTVESLAKRKPSQRDLDKAVPKRNEKTGYYMCPFCDEDSFAELNNVWHHFDEKCMGKIVGLNLKNENGMSAYVPFKNISDRYVKNVFDFIKINQLVIGTIMKIDFQKLKAEVSLRESDFKKCIEERKRQRDRYFDNSELNKKKSNQNPVTSKPTIVNRLTFHPQFKNINYAEFEKVSKHFKNGDYIIRPSSKGSNHLTISWKITDGLFRHIGIVEEEKENEFSIGKILHIESEQYDDLDDVIANYIQPMIGYTDEIFNYKYYKNIKDEGRLNLDKLITEEKQKNPKRIPYFIVPMFKYPGRFTFVFVPHRTVCRDSFLITNRGYQYREGLYQNLNQLLTAFKVLSQNPSELSNRKRPLQERINERIPQKIPRY